MKEVEGCKTKYELVLLAKLAQQTERYGEMIMYANKLFVLEDELTASERNLCASAYKNKVANHRAELKVLEAAERKISSKDNQSGEMGTAIEKYRGNIEEELRGVCYGFIRLIEEKVMPKKFQIKSVEAKVFYLKMRADFYRYLCEIDDSDENFNKALQCYEEADHLARSNLPPTNEVRASLHLNMSVFFFERCGETEKALELANRAFDEAVANVNQTNEQSFKNCTMILQLIRDNITLWGGGEQ